MFVAFRAARSWSWRTRSSAIVPPSFWTRWQQVSCDRVPAHAKQLEWLALLGASARPTFHHDLDATARSDGGVQIYWNSVRVTKLRVPLSPECIPRLLVALEAGCDHAGVNLIDL
jgi:hypothetical protein